MLFAWRGILAAALGLYCLTIPRTPPRKSTIGWLAPWIAFRELRGRPFYVYAICTLGVSAVLPFSTQVTPMLMASLGIEKHWLMPTLTIAQGSEVVTLAMLPLALGRLGVRRTMQIGLIATVICFGSLMIGSPLSLVISGYAFYGMCISCFLVAGQMYINRQAHAGIRASAQALHSVLCGLGQLVGNPLCGLVRKRIDETFFTTFAVATGIAAILFVIFAIGFPRERTPAPAACR